MIKANIFYSFITFILSVLMCYLIDRNFDFNLLSISYILISSFLFNFAMSSGHTKEYKENLKEKNKDFQMSSLDKNLIFFRLISAVAVTVSLQLI